MKEWTKLGLQSMKEQGFADDAVRIETILAALPVEGDYVTTFAIVTEVVSRVIFTLYEGRAESQLQAIRGFKGALLMTMISLWTEQEKDAKDHDKDQHPKHPAHAEFYRSRKSDDTTH